MSENTVADTIEMIRDRIKARNEKYHLDTGRDLIKAKDMLAHGDFGPWLKSNFGWSESTAQNYMNAAKLVDKTPEFGSLKPSAQAALASKSTPESAKAEVKATITSGNTPSVKAVKTTIAAHKAKSTAAAPATPAAKPKQATASTAIVSSAPASPAASQSKQDDLVARLRAAGLDAVSDAVPEAFQGYLVVSADEVIENIERVQKLEQELDEYSAELHGLEAA